MDKYDLIGKDVETVGDLKEILEVLDDDLLVRVNDDGRNFSPSPSIRNEGASRFLEL